MSTDVKMQYILDENKELVEIPKYNMKQVEKPIQYNLISAFEVFVPVKKEYQNIENYWISNYGRLVNNLRHPGENKFYEHRIGNVHYTIYEIERYIESFRTKKQSNGKRKVTSTKGRLEHRFTPGTPIEKCYVMVEEMQKADESRKYELGTNRYKIETSPEELVAEAFLVSYLNRRKIWHRDSDLSYNWYKNLIYVSDVDFEALKKSEITLESLNLEQEYIEYENSTRAKAYQKYYTIKNRCGYAKDNEKIGKCYDGVTMCQEWLDNPESFVKWYLEHYYEVEGESMAVDKDLFGKGSKVYSPENCCILPQGLNTLLSNCKRHYKEGETRDNVLPLCVRLCNGKYHAEIRFTGETEAVRLSDWDTAEEAFAEYKMMKQADIRRVAAKYCKRIPEYIYKELLKVEVEPY